ncbi:MAG: serine hydrolase domain-containing protein [Caldilineaceae bacterium]
MDDLHVVGATVSVVKAGELLFAKGYGYADWENKTPVDAAQTLFYPGSTGKLMTWTALMQLVEQGKIDLDADVNQYLDFTIPATFDKPITIENLLTHTTGFEEQLAALLVAEQGDLLPLGEFLRRNLPALIPLAPPGPTRTMQRGWPATSSNGSPANRILTMSLRTSWCRWVWLTVQWCSRCRRCCWPIMPRAITTATAGTPRSILNGSPICQLGRCARLRPTWPILCWPISTAGN